MRGALSRARRAIASVLAAYLIAVAAGIIATHAGHPWALRQRDRVVVDASTGIISTQSRPIQSALLDCAGNVLGALQTTVLGVGVVLAFPMVVHRGWIGGIVSVDDHHASRLTGPTAAAYYLSVVALQLAAFGLTGGAGVQLGLANLRRGGKRVRWLLGLPEEALLDVVRLYALALPIFLVASLWEFLSPWR